MDIAQFIRIIRNNLILLIAIPILLAIVVFYFTRNFTHRGGLRAFV